MIRYTIGDIFKSDADCLINTVNCEGYMGKGIAYQFKLKFPQNNKNYIEACKNKTLRIGTLHYFKENGKTIINFPTKDRWRLNSKIEYIVVGLDELALLLPKLDVSTIAIPPLGCGNGGLNWSDVKGLIEEKLGHLKDKYDFIIYEPSASFKQVAMEAPKLSASCLVLLKIRMNLEKFNFLRMQKTAYFMNIFLGQDYFKFEKHKYGPYAHSIDIIARSIKEYQSYYSIDNSEDTYNLAYKVLCSEKVNNIIYDLSPSIIKATKFVNSIKSESRLECVATVMFIIQKNINCDEKKIVELFKNWSDEKAIRFTEKEIIDSISYLEKEGIIYKDIVGNYIVTDYVL